MSVTFDLESVGRIINRVTSFQQSYSKPQYIKSNAISWINVLTVDDVDRLLTIRGLEHPDMYLLNSDRGIQKIPFYPYTDGYGRLYSPSKVIFEHLKNGTSLSIQNLQSIHPTASSIYHILNTPRNVVSQIACFLTPPNSQATIPHADDHPNIIIQTSGSKLWRVWDIVDELEISNQGNIKSLESYFLSLSLRDPLLEVSLSPGDIIVIPQRYLHTATTASEYSVSISLQLRKLAHQAFIDYVLIDNICGLETRKDYYEFI